MPSINQRFAVSGAAKMRVLLPIFAALVILSGGFVTVQPTRAASNDVYDTPGIQTVNGRKWSTSCEKYSSNVDRCWTYIWGTKKVNGVNRQDWQFNNLTYLASNRAAWGSNPLANNGSWTDSDGSKWRTECDTKNTGRNGCRTYRNGVFNNMVRFTTGNQKNDRATNYTQYAPRNAAGKFVSQNVPAPAMTINVWTTGGQAQINQCRGAVNYAMNYASLGSPWIAEHDYCGGKRFHKLRVGNVVKLTGVVSGTYRVSSIKVLANYIDDDDHFFDNDAMIQTCLTGTTNMYAALQRIG